MKDGFGRTIDYLRISVTDRCNLRCRYCMPEEGVDQLSHEEILRYEDILRLASIFAKLGVRKVRLTGGEPLARKGLAALVEGLRAIDGIREVAVTTNGTLLTDQLPGLLAAGLTGVNISLDTLREETFRQITPPGGGGAHGGGHRRLPGCRPSGKGQLCAHRPGGGAGGAGGAGQGPPPGGTLYRADAHRPGKRPPRQEGGRAAGPAGAGLRAHGPL